MIWNKQIN